MSDLHVRYLLVPVLVFVAQASDTSYLADFWHHLARGEMILERGELLDHDIFTFTAAGTPVGDMNWLTQVAYAWLFQLGGLALVRTANALVLALALGLLVHLCRRHSDSLVLAMAVGLVTFLGLWQVLTIRPQTFSMALFVAVLALLWRGAREARLNEDVRWDAVGLVVGVPILQSLWANLHGAFPIGLALIGCFGLAELVRVIRQRKWSRRLTLLAVCLILAAAATLLNPYAVEIYHWMRLNAARSKGRGIDEWLPPSLDEGIGVAFFVSLPALAVVLALAWHKKRQLPTLEEVVLLLCFLPLAALGLRMVTWWLIVAAFPLTRGLAALLPRALDGAERPKPSAGAAATVAVLLLLAVFSTPWLSAVNPLLSWKSQPRVEDHLEAALVHLKKEQAQGRIFARFEWGEYLGWRGRPDFPVFMDGRIEICPDEVWDAYSRITQGDGWDRLLEQYQVDALILDRTYHGKGLLPQVEKSERWRLVFESGPVAVFTPKRRR